MKELLLVFVVCMAACNESRSDPRASGKEATLDRLRRGCTAKSGADCREVGRRYQNGEEVPRSETEAVRYYELGCDAGDAASCHASGQAYLLGFGVVKDVDRAVQLLTKACDAGDPDGCFKLGGIQAGGPFGPTIDGATGFRFFVKTCDLGLPAGCYSAGHAAEFGRHGGPGDSQLATTLYRKGCGVSDEAPLPATLTSFGQASACWRLGLSGAREDKTRRDGGEKLLHMVRDYFSRQCDAGDHISCFSLGVIYSTGEGAVVDMSRARTLFERACDLKNPAGCEQADRMRQRE